MAARGLGLFSRNICIENFNDLLVRNHWTDFNITLQKCFLCNPLSRLFKLLWFVKKHSHQGSELISLYIYRENFKNLPVRNHQTDFIIAWQKCFSLVTLYQDCSSDCDLSKNMAARGWGLFSIYKLYRKVKNLLVINHQTDFNITWQECFFGDPLPRLLKLSWFVKKHGC